jgi:hypothetical protein
MREMSKNELEQVGGGLKSPMGVRKQPDDGDIKLHPVPYRRDGVPRIPEDPGLVLQNTQPGDDSYVVQPHVDTVIHRKTSGTDTRPNKPIRNHMNFVRQLGD